MASCPLVWIIIGVSGSGKSVVGRLLSERLDCDFLEGDRRHPLANIKKMISHTPLEDEDRRQWLLNIEADIQRAIDLRSETVITCSGLKSSYRRQLESLDLVQLVWLNVPEEELQHRLANRENHFMQSDMLKSQLEAFEPITSEEHIIIVDGVLTPRAIVEEIISQAAKIFPNLKRSWWQRCEDEEKCPTPPKVPEDLPNNIIHPTRLKGASHWL
jgi:gluconokinase